MKWFYKLKLRKKILTSMMVITLITIIVGAIAVYFVVDTRDNNNAIHRNSFVPMAHLAIMFDSLAQQRIASIGIVTYFQHDMEFVEEEISSIRENDQLFRNALEHFGQSEMDEAEKALFDEIVTSYNEEFSSAIEDLIAQAKTLNNSTKIDLSKKIDNYGMEISDKLDQLFEINESQATTLIDENNDQIFQRIITLSAIGLIAIIISIFISVMLSRIIQAPVKDVERIMRHVGSTGDIYIPQEMRDATDVHELNGEEFAELACSLRLMMHGIQGKVRILEQVSKGDLTKKVDLIGENDSLGIAVSDVISNFSKIIKDVSDVTTQLTSSASQIASSAMELANVSTMQASNIGQLNTVAEQIYSKAKENADRAADATGRSIAISNNAAEGAVQMVKMTNAVNDISVASNSINSVMKAIDEIAFQTRILSLNAAVEAARAGVHGKGFAVVADEVRNLASKSSNAANNTNEMISDTILKAEQGTEILQEVSSSFSTIEEGVNQISELLAEITEAASSQQRSIEMINTNVVGFTDIINSNSARSEESAAASDQMKNQAHRLQELVSKFILPEENGMPSYSKAKPVAQMDIKPKAKTQVKNEDAVAPKKVEKPKDQNKERSLIDEIAKEKERFEKKMAKKPQSTIVEPVVEKNMNMESDAPIESKAPENNDQDPVNHDYDGLTPAQIYAGAMAKLSNTNASSIKANPVHEAEVPQFTDDDSKY